jgi:hypothetical protein
MGRVERARPELIPFVLRIAAGEPDGDHYLSHWVMAVKVLRCKPVDAIGIATAFAHRRLTRELAVGLLADWREEGWVQ